MPSRLLLATGVLAGALAGPAVATGTAVARPDACTVSYAAPAGDAPAFYVAPSDPDLDVTGVRWQVGATDVVVTAKVAKLADRPAAGWGDEFDAVVSDRTTGRQVTFGYFRSPSGGGPVLAGGTVPAAQSPAGVTWNAYPGAETHLLADFDVARSQVVLTIPRADLAAAFGVPFEKLVLTGLGVNSYVVDATYDAMMADFGQAALDPRATFLAVRDCDRWAAKHRARPAAPSPCGLDVVAATGDETSRTSDAAPTRDDSVDVARVSFRLTATDLLVTARIARLADRPLFGTGQGYSVRLGHQGAVAEFGVTRDLVDGSRVRQYGGTTVSPLTVTGTVDGARHLVTLKVPRAAIATAFGVKDSRGLVVANPGVTAFWTVDGQSVATADADATAENRALSFAACDKSRTKH